MEWEIQQVQQVDAKEYWIRKEGQNIAYAAVRTRNSHTYIDVNSLRNSPYQWRFSAKRLIRFWKLEYEIELTDGRIAAFRRISRRKNIYEAQLGEETYSIYSHKYLSASIFCGDEQVAFLSKRNVVTVLDNDRYKLLCNRETPIELMVIIALIWDGIYAYRSGINLGQLTEYRAPNLDWEPH